ncbi:hypothetical protein I302_102012 [Kwoniella bestiolae CBS 10118]|uniref:Protein UNC80 C-terminal domain-containing protein n=1 Tax=Kwoniella bestiolae CBS 10118 TaxID=1296100 RepID=A0A1B9GDS6_9TREE|nr:hypothetical protein I302_00696 [Kwoniella bestiolae CBS 10118]OCF29200.1 hypothetical protein I302_00696 [Kwoniella bestiolae CBS 10118]
MGENTQPTSPPSLRQGKRVPSGPRPPPLPLRGSPTSSRISTASTKPSIREQTSFGSLSKLISTPIESPLDSIIDAEHDYTVSPESSPDLSPIATTSKNALPILSPPPVKHAVQNPPLSQSRPHAQTITALPMSRETSKNRAQTMPDGERPITPTSASFVVTRPITPTGIKSPPKSKSKPKPSRLNTSNLMTSTTSSPTKLVSPGMQHWQQVRTHVIAPTPAEEKSSHHHYGRTPAKKMTGLVSKAAGRFGFKHAADNVIGYNDRRQSMMGILSDMNDLSKEEKESITRERRKFARDVKVCLDACCLEESKRRLTRIGYDNNGKSTTTYNAETKSSGMSMHHNGSVHTSSHMQKFTFDPEFSAFAPLLMELHKHLPSARSKKPWSRTCPHHSAILAELGSAFLQDSTSTDGERQQALEVFGVIVKNWASDNADEELERWLWLSRALLGNDRQVRNRGLALLNRFLHPDASLPKGLDRPRSALAFLSLACALIQLLHAIEMSGYGNEDHLQMVNGFLADLSEGDIIDLEETSLVELLGSLELGGSLGGVDKELVWMAVGMIIGTQPSMAPWLLIEKGQVLQRFYPPPLLHATPPIILNLRSRSFSLFFTSFTSLISASLDVPLATRLWRSARDMLIPEVEHLPDEDGSLAVSLAAFLFELELQGHKLQPSKVEEADPFRISMEPKKDVKAGVTEHRDLFAEYSSQKEWKAHFEVAAKQVIYSAPLEAVCRMIQSFLQNKTFLALGKDCVNALFSRLTSSSSPLDEARPFLTWLSRSHPQLFYKPLFSCSASTSSSSLLPHLKLVRNLSQSLGPARLWTQADPQMVVIVLVGDAAPKQLKGKGKEGEKVTVNVKLGRYAVLMGLIEALDKVDEPAGSGTRLRTFIENVEARLAAFLEAEERDGSLPEGYRGLICQLLFKMRDTTMSIKRSAWLKSVLAWFMDLASADPYRNAEAKADDEQLSTLKTLYQGMASSTDSQDKSTPMISSPPSKWTGDSARRDSLPLLSERKKAIFDNNLAKIAPFLLVTVHAALTMEEWEALLPRLWHYYDSSRPSRKGLTFLLEKCAERIPNQLNAIVISDLTSDYNFVRSHALSKIAMLFGWRFQVLAQRILTDRRGPVFQFTSKTLEFVATEIGSPDWVPSHDVQDAALKKFGRTLPLELRQRLMELGWSEDESLQAKSDWEQVPVSALPALQYQQEGMNVERSPSPMRSLTRKGSSGSGSSYSGKRRKAIFSPTLLAMVNEQARTLAGEIDGPISTTSLEIVKLLQRDDPTGLLRPIAEGFADDFPGSLARLNCIFATLTPGFAYAALNTLVGHLKTMLRNSPHFDHHALALATISRLVPSTSEFSLRDIRKNKAEHVLLPASIHEDEGGFKVHAPWRDGQLDVQTSQLLILTESLRANPREVYLFKKMLSNLQIRDSIPHLPFARAWLLLISTLFSAVNRNYNDRAELRHFLTNVGNILQIHGQKDLLVAAHAMRVFMLCSARFRRLFATMGFSTIMRSVYDTYSGGSSALKDCIEYASRSFYRIHQDSFVYQTCVVISEGDYDASEVYSLLSNLSRGNSESSGVSSGIKDLNNQEEIDALVQMLSGPEIALSDLGQAFSEKQSLKQVSAITLEETIFPKENIIKLFVTVIAANPATIRASNFLKLLSGLVPHISTHRPSHELLREGVEVLGSVIQKGKTGDEAAISAFHPGSNESTSDWTAARREYVFLVESFARSGGQLGASATKRTLDMVLDLLRRQPESVGPAASSIVSCLAKTHLSSSKPTPFLRDIAPLFRMFIAVVEFSGVLDSITDLIKRSSFDLDGEITSIIVEDYVEPAIRMLASAAEESMAFIVPLRSSAVKLLAAAVFLRGDALGALERHPPSASLLASLVLPLCLLLEPPEEVDREAVYGSLWIRLLHYVLKARDRQKTKTVKTVTTNQVIAATVLLTVQIVKVIFIRASESISSVKGLWTYVSSYLLRVIEDGNASFAESAIVHTSPRMVDWIMWSLFEVVCLHKNPIMIDIRFKLQLVLNNIHKEAERSAPPSPSLGGGGGQFSNPPVTSQSMSGRARRISSARAPSGNFESGGRSRLPSATYPDMSGFGLGLGQGLGQSRTPSTKLTPEYMKSGSHSRMPSQSQQFLTPFIATPPTTNRIGSHGRMPSQSSLTAGAGLNTIGSSGSGSGSGGIRPSFSALSARRVSRPAFDVFQNGVGMNYRFPSSGSGDFRNLSLSNEKTNPNAGGGAIVHLLSTPNQILSATSSGFPTISPTHSPISPTGKNPFHGHGQGVGGDGKRGESALRDVRVKNERLCEMSRKSIRLVRLINGYENNEDDGLLGEDAEDEDEMMRSWNVLDALNVISEQTRLFVEEEFRDLFSPISSSSSNPRGLGDISAMLDQSLTDKEREKEKEKRESGYSLAPEGYSLDLTHNHHEGIPEEEEESMRSFRFGLGFNEKRRQSSLTKQNNNVPLLSVSEN